MDNDSGGVWLSSKRPPKQAVRKCTKIKGPLSRKTPPLKLLSSHINFMSYLTQNSPPPQQLKRSTKQSSLTDYFGSSSSDFPSHGYETPAKKAKNRLLFNDRCSAEQNSSCNDSTCTSWSLRFSGSSDESDRPNNCLKAAPVVKKEAACYHSNSHLHSRKHSTSPISQAKIEYSLTKHPSRSCPDSSNKELSPDWTSMNTQSPSKASINHQTNMHMTFTKSPHSSPLKVVQPVNVVLSPHKSMSSSFFSLPDSSPVKHASSTSSNSSPRKSISQSMFSLPDSSPVKYTQLTGANKSSHKSITPSLFSFSDSSLRKHASSSSNTSPQRLMSPSSYPSSSPCKKIDLTNEPTCRPSSSSNEPQNKFTNSQSFFDEPSSGSSGIGADDSENTMCLDDVASEKPKRLLEKSKSVEEKRVRRLRLSYGNEKIKCSIGSISLDSSNCTLGSSQQDDHHDSIQFTENPTFNDSDACCASFIDRVDANSLKARYLNEMGTLDFTQTEII